MLDFPNHKTLCAPFAVFAIQTFAKPRIADPPPHSHVIRGRRKGKGRKEEVLIYLGDQLTPPSIREIKGMKKNDVRKAMEIARRKQEDLLTAWRFFYDQ